MAILPAEGNDSLHVIFRDFPKEQGEQCLKIVHTTQCCIGIGYGDVFAIGPNLAQGDEMNRASRLGEDIARANQTLLTERTCAAVRTRTDIVFAAQNQDDQLFSYYSAALID